MSVKIKAILKKLLQERDMTSAQLARACKVPPQTINNWLSGQNPRNLEQIKVVADNFGVTIDYLAFGTDIKKSCLSKNNNEPIEEYRDEINAGTFEVVLRRVRK